MNQYGKPKEGKYQKAHDFCLLPSCSSISFFFVLVLLTKTAFKMQGQKLIPHSCITRELIAWCEKEKKQRVKMDIKTKRKLKFGKSIGNQTTVLKNVAAMPVALILLIYPSPTGKSEPKCLVLEVNHLAMILSLVSSLH